MGLLSVFLRKKLKVTYEQLGDILVGGTLYFLYGADDNKDPLKDLIERLDGLAEHIDIKNLSDDERGRKEWELLIWHMFAVTTACRIHFSDSTIQKKVLDNYHEKMYERLSENGDEVVLAFQKLVVERYKAYYEELNRSRRPHWWPEARALRYIIGGEYSEKYRVTDSALVMSSLLEWEGTLSAYLGALKGYDKTLQIVEDEKQADFSDADLNTIDCEHCGENIAVGIIKHSQEVEQEVKCPKCGKVVQSFFLL